MSHEIVPVPEPFDLDLVVRSHGWYDLPPWQYDEARRVLGRPFLLRNGRVVYAEVAPTAGSELVLRLTTDGKPPAGAGEEVRAALRTCLGLDEDLSAFYDRIMALCRQPPTRLAAPLPNLTWAVKRGAGRLLRSATVFEDAVKTLCTTNCTWALTRVMIANLVERLGVCGPLKARCFPTPPAMAAMPERFYRETIRAGYRAPFLRALAAATVSGTLDCESWRRSPLDTAALGKEIQRLDGFGPYATEHLLRLLGRHDHLALDSWNRKKLARLRGKRKLPTDRTLKRWYAPYGPWAGLAMWLEATADWHVID